MARITWQLATGLRGSGFTIVCAGETEFKRLCGRKRRILDTLAKAKCRGCSFLGFELDILNYMLLNADWWPRAALSIQFLFKCCGSFFVVLGLFVGVVGI